MPYEVVGHIHVLDRCSKVVDVLAFGWWDGTKIVNEPQNETDQYDEPDNEKIENHNYDDDSQYFYNPKSVFAEVNNNPPRQE